MRSLFPLDLPEGFIYEHDFLSEAEESHLVRQFETQEFAAYDFHGYTAKRRVVSYGVSYQYGTRQVSVTKPFPDFLFPIRQRAAAIASVTPEALVQAMILEYPPGAPIGWHRDAPQFGTIIGISLLSSARMRLKPYTFQPQNSKGPILSIDLAPRSIYVLSGAARSEWQHSIPAVEKLRYSITFRTVRQKSLRNIP